MPYMQLTGPQHLYVSRGADIIHLKKAKSTQTSLWQQQQVLKGHQGDVCCFAVKSGRLVSCGMDKMLRLWDLGTGCCEGVFFGHTDCINSVDYRGDIIVSGSRDKSVKVLVFPLFTVMGVGNGIS